MENNKKFVKGFKVKAVPLKYGTIFKCGVPLVIFVMRTQ
jgi:hypothetical protein